MLQTIRDRAQGFLAWVILILISIPFALWGIQNYFSSGKERPVAVVGDKEIFERDVNRAYEQNLAGLVDLGQFSEEQLRQQALDRLINEAVLAQAAADSKLVVNDATVAEYIQSMPYFQTDGQFDKEKYRLMLSSQGIAASQFVSQVRQALEMEQYQGSVIASSFVTDQELNAYYRLKNQEREIEYFILPVQPSERQITDAEIEEYYQKNQALFRTPEQVSVQYIELDLNEIAKQIQPSEEELRAYYEEQKAAYTTEERRKVRHILIALPPDADEQAENEALEKARAAKQRIEKGEGFAAAAKELSDDQISAEKGGDLGFISRGMMEKSFEEAAFALSEGEVSEPVKTPFGYHLIKVTEIEASTVKPFEEARDEVLKTVQRNAAENKFYELGETLAQTSYENPKSLEPAAHALGLEIKQTDLFTREKGEGLAAEQAIREAAFDEEVLAGNNSEPVELSSDRVVVLRANEHIEATNKPLAEVKDEIFERLRTQAAQAKTRQDAEALLQQLKEGKSLNELAESVGQSVKQPKPLRRDSTEQPWQITQAVFKAPRPQGEKPTALLAPLPSGEQALINLLTVKEGDPGKLEAEERKSMQAQLETLRGRLALNDLLAQLRDQTDVEVKALSKQE